MVCAGLFCCGFSFSSSSTPQIRWYDAISSRREPLAWRTSIRFFSTPRLEEVSTLCRSYSSTFTTTRRPPPAPRSFRLSSAWSSCRAGRAAWSRGSALRTPLLLGSILAGLGFLAFAMPGTDGSYWTTFFPAATILGLGGALFVAPLTTTVMDSVSVDHAGVASGVNNAIARTAGLIGIAALGIVVTSAPSYVSGFRTAMVVSALLAFCAGAVAAAGLPLN